MEKNNIVIEKLVMDVEQEISLEDTIVEHIEKTEELWETCFFLDELYTLTKVSSNLRTFPKIEKCVNLLDNQEKDIELREAIVSSVVKRFFPLLNSDEKSGEIITKKQIKEVANKLGKVILDHDYEDDYKKDCAAAFIETIVLT